MEDELEECSEDCECWKCSCTICIGCNKMICSSGSPCVSKETKSG